MKRFTDIRIAAKLAIGFGCCLLLAVISGTVSIQRMSVMNAAAGIMYGRAVKGIIQLEVVKADVKKYRDYQERLALAVDPDDKSIVEQTLTECEAQTPLDIQAYAQTCTDPVDTQNAAKLPAEWQALVASTSQIRLVTQGNDRSEIAKSITGPSHIVYHNLLDQLQVMTDWNQQHAKVLFGECNQAYNSARLLIAILLAFATIFGVILATIVTKLITTSIAEVNDRLHSLDTICLANLSAAVKAIAGGDLTAEIVTGTTLLATDRNDEFGELAKSLNGIILKTQDTVTAFRTAQHALSELIGQTRDVSDTIVTSSNEIASGNTDLADRTSEQASSLEETAASMEELTGTVKSNADSARRANDLAAAARDVAQSGGAVVKSAVASMEEINQSSRRISDIISVIDEIAFQTNLLALNAAVEAARVGEQGRGFAVVAAEVRSLAGRSSTAAKEIKALVQDSARKVDEGTTLVNKSGEQLTEIVAAVNSVAEIVGEITAASQEQAAGIDQVNRAVMQMDEITQQNAALVEEASAAAESMAQQANDLQLLVSRFKYEGQHDLAINDHAQPARALATGTHGKAPLRPQAKRQPLRIVSAPAPNDNDEF